MIRVLLVFLSITSIASAFTPVTPQRLVRRQASPVSTTTEAQRHSQNENEHDTCSSSLSRRGFVEVALTTFSATVTLNTMLIKPALADVDSKPKVLVLGGTGFVGSQVLQLLKDSGVNVVATSRNGRDGTMAFDATQEKDIASKIQSLASGCTAVISCIGAIGTDTDEQVNAATGLAAFGAKAAGVKTFVYITVAPEVVEFARNVDFLKPYLKGKAFSRASVLETFGDGAVFIEPTFIYGGGSFEVNPPRVASFYGQIIEGLLSSNPIRTIDRVLSPGIFKIALEPPVPVEAIAHAAVAGALGKSTVQALDTYDKIRQAAQLVKA